MANTPRRPANPKDAAEALFAPAKKVAAPAVEKRAPPAVKEQVTLRLDSAVIEYFQEGGPGWQDRINDALRAVMEAAPKG
ncbi:BrnA antitoxin family protein [Neorhizobium sp. NPDC001467]|uniref:BrnA antitoxin family protein n=1 Tax=Neorhizobium sp. NPDC001467 TaxID=3390595 RepID=UPI003CFF727F